MTEVLQMDANLMSWQDRRIGDGDSTVNWMTYNDRSRGDLHVIIDDPFGAMIASHSQ